MLRLLLTFCMLALSTSAWATTYWVSTGGGATLCSQIDGDADPGAYMTLAAIDSNNCATSGDTVMFKAGTYTGTHKYMDTLFVSPSGASASTRSKVLCEGDQTCTIAFDTATLGGNLSTGGQNVRYFQMGDRGNGFISDCVNGGSTCYGIRFNLPVASGGAYLGNVVRGNRVRNHHRNGISNREHDLNAYFDGMEISWNTVESAASPEDTGDGNPHPIYVSQRNATVEHNDVTTGADHLSGQFALHCFHICDGSIFRYNTVHIHGPTRGFISSNGDIARVAGSKVQVYGNVFTTIDGTPPYCVGAYGNGTPIDVYNNVFDGCTNGYDQASFGGSHSTTNIKNNVSTGATMTVCDVSAGVCTSSNNTVNAVAATHFVDSANANYSLKAGSALINAGVAITGFAYNGSAPDIGAHETIPHSVCVVENATPTKLSITFENNVNPPMLPASSITGFTARKAGANDVITAAVRTGDNQIDLTLTNAIVAGNAVDYSYAQTGNATDSALIGGTISQELLASTNVSCTNNVGGAPSHVFTQAAFEFHGLRGTEAAPVGTPYATAPENTNILVRVGGSVRLRLAVTCTTADCPPTGFYPRYSKNAGAYTVVPDVFAADNIGFCGTSPDPDIPASGTATTDQLSTSGTFVAGALVRTSNAIPTIDMAQNGKTEQEYCFSFDTDATAGDTYDIREYQQDGTALGAYTVTPRITLAAPSAGMGF